MKTTTAMAAINRCALAALLCLAVSACAPFWDNLHPPDNTAKRDSNSDNVFEGSINYDDYCPSGGPGRGQQCMRFAVAESFQDAVRFFHPCYNVIGTTATGFSYVAASDRIERVYHFQCKGESGPYKPDAITFIDSFCKGEEPCFCPANQRKEILELQSILHQRRTISGGKYAKQARSMAESGFQLNKLYCSEFSREIGRRQRYREETKAQLGAGNIFVSGLLAFLNAGSAAVGLSAIGFQSGQSYVEQFDSIYSFGNETGRIFEVAAKAMIEIEAATAPNIQSYQDAVGALLRHSQVCSNAGISRLLNYSIRRAAEGKLPDSNLPLNTAALGLPLEVQRLLNDLTENDLNAGQIRNRFNNLSPSSRKDLQQFIGVDPDGRYGELTEKRVEEVRKIKPDTPLADLFPGTSLK